MGQKRSYKQYPKEFKEEAVGLVLEGAIEDMHSSN
jgi:transposase-like protein